MHSLIRELEKTQLKPQKELRIGDEVRFQIEIVEGNKKRLQAFEGMIMKKRGEGLGATVTVRKTSAGIGVEKIIPVHMPALRKIEVVRRGRVRRAKLYFLRGLTGKASKVREDLDMVRADKAERRKKAGAAPAKKAEAKKTEAKAATEKAPKKAAKPKAKAKSGK
jgi:large subunit ribosomal protein L19